MMSLQRNLLASLLLLGAASPALAASFDCNRASTPQEKLICQTPQLSSLDETLANVYHQKMSGLAAADAVQLKQSQREWLKQLRSHGTDVDQLQTAYQQRIAALNITAASPAAVSKAPATDAPQAPAQSAPELPITTAHYVYQPGSVIPEPYTPPPNTGVSRIMPEGRVIIRTGTYRCGFNNIPDPANGTAYTLVSLQVGTDSINMLNQHFALVQIKHQPYDHTRSVPSFMVKEFRSADNQTIITHQFDEFRLLFIGVIKGKKAMTECEFEH